ncbi:MAG: hypothetical protein KQJ78_19800 [Deltaproteobacteria bacterium]|nr:hypothetical protein [Deltaproteobacteria bacterium]
MSRAPRKITPGKPVLALHLGALGDFVLSWPALARLAAAAPAGGLHVVGQPAWARLILPPERVHWREAARFAPLFLAEPHPELDAWLAGCGLAVVFAHRPPPELLAHLRSAVSGPVWAVPTRPPEGEVRHAGEGQEAFLRERGLTGAAPAWDFPGLGPLPPARPVILPGSGGRAKRLPPELAARLARRLHEVRGREAGPPMVVLGPAEDPAFRDELARALAGVPHQVLADPEFPELAARLAAARPYVGADSGPSHLAAALGAPTLAGFAATDPRIWAPRGPRARAVAVGELAAALERLLAAEKSDEA